MSASGTRACILLVGTYTQSLPHVRGRGAGIHLLGFDTRTGALSDGPVVPGLENPTYLAVSRDGRRLYAVQELGETEGASVETFALDAAARTVTRLSSVPALGGHPCHVGLDASERRLFVSNYSTGSFVTFALDREGLPKPDPLKIQRSGSSVNADRQQGPHVHQGVPTPDGEHVMVCDLGTDEIVRHRLSGDTIEPEPDLVVKADAGTLPRHLAVLPDGSGFLVVHEIGAKIVAYGTSAAGARRVGEISSLPKDWRGANSGAGIRVHPGGRFAYVSNRGHDTIFGVDLADGLGALKPIGWWSTCGETPRDLNIDPTGRFLVAANQDSHSLTVFAIDPATGALALESSGYPVASPVCLVFVPIS